MTKKEIIEFLRGESFLGLYAYLDALSYHHVYMSNFQYLDTDEKFQLFITKIKEEPDFTRRAIAQLWKEVDSASPPPDESVKWFMIAGLGRVFPDVQKSFDYAWGDVSKLARLWVEWGIQNL